MSGTKLIHSRSVTPALSPLAFTVTTTLTTEETIHLTRREQDALRHIFAGCSTKQAAEKLFVSKRTVDFHVANVYLKLGVKSRMQALLRLQELGWFSTLMDGGGK